MTKKRSHIPLALCLAASVLALACSPESVAPASPEPLRGSYTRIVAMAPSITETLFAVGAGEIVIGVTRYCIYPPEARTRAIIGGFFDPNYEVIVTLEPDLVVLLTIQDEARQRFEALNIRTLTVDQRTLPGILDSIRAIGEATGHTEEALALIADTEERTRRIAAMTAGRPRPRVLISAGRVKGAHQLTEVNAAGKGEWYDDIIEMAGGTNACTSEMIQFPTISLEGLYEIDPDVIVDMASADDLRAMTEAEILAQWSTAKHLRALKEGRVHILSGSHTTIPGPRYVQIVEDLAKLLHPDLDWES